MQYEAPSAHLPSAPHSREQQSAGAVQALPAVLHAWLTARQLPLAQLPLQQALPAVQVCPSAVQAVAHLPSTQDSEQQSVATPQLVPAGLHEAIADLHVLLV